ncbi:type II toxin-antitoxin system HigB family toxin [Hymenobacter weizhouensis]|uniref:type II toxin-antitoxin system HigB family toxin n=1 Tax=Hymenobacter sp. YIM 151500-1 TaxID=2987689 RepID=UPI0022277E40|nr:type II toxin-antitoxin system HigB family toxin [Hymenobacter sp. YIM 151500-1]UYZ61567.1 type II toxin-antitoxin system HigB family toxin [Hymenobacter sp. YIM 151500-1]
MVIIKLQPLREFIQLHPDARPSLSQWIKTVEQADWGTPNELKAVYPSASLVANDRVVFNIGGNKYRLVVLVIYGIRTVFIRFIGTHSAYDQLDVSTV